MPSKTTLYAASNMSSAIIEISFKLPDFKSLEEARAVYKSEAEQVMAALKYLPQGTRHQLLILMLEEKGNLLMHS